MGFITARLTPLAESDPKDRALLGLAGAAADRQRAVYILTLGTVPALRQQVAVPALQLAGACGHVALHGPVAELFKDVLLTLRHIASRL